MNQALAILAHALRMLTHEPVTTLRVVAPAILIICVTMIATLMFLPDLNSLFPATPDSFTAPDTSVAFLGMVMIFANLVGYALMAILWHRHVLLSGTGGDSDLKSGAAVMFGYLGRMFFLALVQLAVAVPIAIVMAILAGLTATLLGPDALIIIISITASLLFIWIALRLSVVLPAAALGMSMPIGESWSVTAPAAKNLWWLAGLLVLLNTLIALITNAILPDGTSAVLIVQTLIFILEGLVFISVLTTLYGHLVEERTLG